MPATFDTELVIGDTRRLAFAVEDLDQDELANLDDLDTATYVIVEDIETADVIIQKELGEDGLTITTAGAIDSVELDDLQQSDPVISVFLSPEDTQTLPTNTVEHELQLQDTAGNVTTVMQGTIDPIETAIEPRQP